MNEHEEKFLKENVEPIFNEYRKAVMLKIFKNEEKLKNQILKVLENLAKKAKEIEDYKVKYIDFSLLQVEFLRESYELSVIAYDDNWYAEEGIWEVSSVDYIFDELKVIKEKLYRDIKKYVGNIRASCIDQYILKQLPIYNIYFSYFLIKWLKQWDEEVSFKEMPKGETLQVIWGEYKNYSQKVFYYDSNIKTEEVFKEKIKKCKKEEMVFSMWAGLKADKLRIENKDISCMNLKECKLKNTFFSSSMAVGLNFKKADLRKCYFRNCDLGASDFSESYLEDVVFENCILRNTNFKNSQFNKVYLINGKKVKIIIKEEDFKYQI
ncbi:pentapeptide repeat-containing protein [Clostridium beijerinckii]|uniref:pentapeptide repeat-containing protein n=1 Tax=Clostridium beijerinckii TaxID=1520 RepID=UPI001494C296|nr:pentapeptide repeat-containing protein [Clostridium beijerinckii]NOW04345.1 hypothetical protein [Clostridium beijerinckii]NYC02514.1 hypothetical protein [Clostridium beijerinckii]